MKCLNCGAEARGDFCGNCGADLKSQRDQMSSKVNKVNTYNQSARQTQYQGFPQEEPVLPPNYRPISMWGYFGYQLLFAIPCVGFILLIVFSFGGTQNVNLKNYARSYFCVYILIFAIYFILMLIGVMGAGSSYLFN